MGENQEVYGERGSRREGGSGNRHRLLMTVLAIMAWGLTVYIPVHIQPCFEFIFIHLSLIVSPCPHSVILSPLADIIVISPLHLFKLNLIKHLYTMSEMTATVSKDAKGSINVKGYEQLDYNFHYVTDVFDTKHEKLAKCYERWQRVLIIIDTSESSCYCLGSDFERAHADAQSSSPSTRIRSKSTLTTTTSR